MIWIKVVEQKKKDYQLEYTLNWYTTLQIWHSMNKMKWIQPHWKNNFQLILQSECALCSKSSSRLHFKNKQSIGIFIPQEASNLSIILLWRCVTSSFFFWSIWVHLKWIFVYFSYFLGVLALNSLLIRTITNESIISHLLSVHWDLKLSLFRDFLL